MDPDGDRGPEGPSLATVPWTGGNPGWLRSPGRSVLFDEVSLSPRGGDISHVATPWNDPVPNPWLTGLSSPTPVPMIFNRSGFDISLICRPGSGGRTFNRRDRGVVGVDRRVVPEPIVNRSTGAEEGTLHPRPVRALLPVGVGHGVDSLVGDDVAESLRLDHPEPLARVSGYVDQTPIAGVPGRPRHPAELVGGRFVRGSTVLLDLNDFTVIESAPIPT